MKKFILSILFISSFSLFAQNNGMVVDQKTGKISYDAIGTVTFVKGKVYRTRPEQKSSDEIGINFPILEKDIIQTERKSAIKIRMNDMTIITLGQNSHFNFKNFKNNKNAKRTADLDLKMGNARVEVPVRVAKGELKFNTKTVSLGVRGTEFLMQQEIAANGDSKEQIALLKGEIVVSTENGKSKTMKPQDHYLLKKSAKDNIVRDKMVQLDKKVFDYLKADSVSKNTLKPFLAKLNEQLLNSPSNGDSNNANNSDNSFKKTKNFWEKSLENLNKKLKKNND